MRAGGLRPARLHERPVLPHERRPGRALHAAGGAVASEEVGRLGVLVAVEDVELLPPEQGEELADGRLAAARLADEKDGLASLDAAGDEGEHAAERDGPGDGGGGGLRMRGRENGKAVSCRVEAMRTRWARRCGVQPARRLSPAEASVQILVFRLISMD